MIHRIVLYNPRAEYWTLPLALLSLASSLDRKRFDPVIVDGRIESDPGAKVLDHCNGALFLGCSVLSGTPITDALEVSRAVKARYPDLPVIWGGWHPSVMPESCLEEPSVDAAVQGQGELVLTEIAECLVDGALPDECAGCSTHGPLNEIRRHPPRPLADPGVFPPLDYDLIDVEEYFRHKGRRQIDYISSIGCQYRCSFCADPAVYGRRWAGLDAERIGDDLQRLQQRWRFVDVNFQDESFFTREARVAGVATQLLERQLDLTWAATLRADQGARMPAEVFELCARSGMRRVNVGVEAATREGLENLHKDITPDQIRMTAERCARHGVAASFSFIVGLPDEPLTNVRASLDLAAELRAMDPAFKTPFFFFRPYPGTELGAAMERVGHRMPITLEDWANFDYVGTAGSWVPENVRKLVEPHTLSDTFPPSSRRGNPPKTGGRA